MIANLLPPRVRQAVYVALSTALALEVIWDIVPDGTEGKLLATLSALGFLLAAGNTNKG